MLLSSKVKLFLEVKNGERKSLWKLKCENKRECTVFVNQNGQDERALSLEVKI